MPNARLLGVLLVLCACGGHQESATAESPDGSAPDGAHVDGLVFRDLYPQTPEGGPRLAAQCFDAGLAVGDNGLPNCIVVIARTPPWPGTAEQVAACNACDAPGLERFVAPVPLETIGEGLSNYGCLCAVTPPSPDADCSPFSDDPSKASWCYPGTVPSPFGEPCLTFSPGLSQSGTLYVACFEQVTTQ